MADYFEESFWKMFISRVSQSHPAVYHMVNAVSAAYEAQRGTNVWLDNGESAFAFAQAQCNKGIQSLRSQQFRGSQTLHLLTALLCWQYAALTDRGRGAPHLGYSVRMVKEIAQPGGQDSEDKLSVMEFSLIKDYLEPFILHAGGTIAGGMDPVYAFREAVRSSNIAPQTKQPIIPEKFQSTFQAKDSFRELYLWACSKLVAADTRSGKILPSQSRRLFEDLCQRWRAATSELLSSREQELASNTPDPTCHSGASLIAWERLAYICVTSLNEYSEMSYDKYMSHFEVMIEFCEKAHSRRPRELTPSGKPQPIFAAGMSPNIPLMFICSCCRDPSIRSRMLAIIRDLNEVMGIVSSAMLTFIAEAVIGIEQKGLGNIRSASDIPLSHRIRLHSVAGYPKQGGVAVYRIRYMKAPWDVALGAPVETVSASVRIDKSEIIRVTNPSTEVIDDEALDGRIEFTDIDPQSLPRVIMGRDYYTFMDPFKLAYQVMRPCSWEFMLPLKSFV